MILQITIVLLAITIILLLTFILLQNKSTNKDNEADQHASSLNELKESIEVLKNTYGDKSNELNKNELEKTLEGHRNKLFKIRKERIHPLKDDKVLTDWNGLMIAAMAKGGRVLNNQKYINSAISSADFILNNLIDGRGRLLKRYRVNSAGLQPHIDDYSFFIWGLLELYQATFDTRFLASALNFSEIMVEDFLDKKNGGFFIGPNNGEKLIVRAKDSYDGAIPSGNSVALYGMVNIGQYFNDSSILDKSNKECARGLCSFSSEEIKKILGHHSKEIEKILGYITKSEVVHKDDMVEI